MVRIQLYMLFASRCRKCNMADPESTPSIFSSKENETEMKQIHPCGILTNNWAMLVFIHLKRRLPLVVVI